MTVAKNSLKILCVVILSCNNADTPKAEQNNPDTVAIKEISEPAIADTILYKSPATKINLKNNSAIVKGSIAASEKPTISFQVDKGSVISMSVQALGPNGNVRINQIQLPGGKLDGPFGASNDYPISQPGVYSIILGEDLMAGDPWTGNWVLVITVK